MKNARNENVIDSYNVINSVKPKCDLLYLWNRIIVLTNLGHLRECIQKNAERVGIAIRLLLTMLIGVSIGTASSIYVASALALKLGMKREHMLQQKVEKEGADQPSILP